MIIARPNFTKLILIQQFFPKNFYAAFRDNPINGLMLRHQHLGGWTYVVSAYGVLFYFQNSQKFN
jgi:galactose-1-phosphate uridylyltransferase